MALPKIQQPHFDLTLPVCQKKIKFRPFLVKEEKLLLMATESQDQAQLISAVTDIITACTDVQDVDKLPTFDIEYLFLQIRTKSVGESIKLSVTCPDDNETPVEVSIPLDEIKVVKTRGHKKDLKVSDDVTITMGYPKLDTFIGLPFLSGFLSCFLLALTAAALSFLESCLIFLLDIHFGLGPSPSPSPSLSGLAHGP